VPLAPFSHAAESVVPAKAFDAELSVTAEVHAAGIRTGRPRISPEHEAAH
jgi:hypothetical protein